PSQNRSKYSSHTGDRPHLAAARQLPVAFSTPTYEVYLLDDPSEPGPGPLSPGCGKTCSAFRLRVWLRTGEGRGKSLCRSLSFLLSLFLFFSFLPPDRTLVRFGSHEREPLSRAKARPSGPNPARGVAPFQGVTPTARSASDGLDPTFPLPLPYLLPAFQTL